MNVLILTTGSGQNFGRSISHRLRRNLVAEEPSKVYRYRVTAIDTAFANHPEFTPQNTVIVCRAAHPTAQWMQRLVAREAEGYRVINTTESLRLSSDKLRFWEAVNGAGLAAYDDDEAEVWTHQLPRILTQQRLTATAQRFSASSPQGVVLKPRYSQGQGTFVHLIPWVSFVDLSYMQSVVETMPSCPLIIQQVIDYTAIYRVVVIDGLACTAAITIDRPEWHDGDWKVSVCLNQHQRHFQVGHLEQTDPLYQKAERLGLYATALQRLVKGEINYIDIYETRDGELVVSEINTACNLSIHSRLTGADFAEVIAVSLAEKVLTV
jgi:glutathione synthase/RimK-type ligase-like ATP-grasp enzyme